MRILLILLFALYIIRWISNVPIYCSKDKYNEYASSVMEQYENLKAKAKNLKRLLVPWLIISEICYVIVAIYVGNEYRHLWFMILILIQIVQWVYSIFVNSLYIEAMDSGTFKERFPYKKYMLLNCLLRGAYYIGGLYLLIRG